MKKFRDILQKEDIEDIDIASLWSMSPTQVQRQGRDIHRDIEEYGRQDLQIWKKTEVRVLRKRGKNFDALERESFIQSLFRGDIVLSWKNRKISFTSIRQHIYDFLSWCTRQGVIFSCALIFFICFIWWYIGKTLVESRVNSGYSKLIEVREWSIELWQIQRNINNARFDLLLADIFFTPFKIFPGDTINSAENIISGWRYLSYALDKLLSLYSTFEGYTSQKDISQIYFTQLFSNISPILRDIEWSLRRSLYEYESISWLPNEDLEDQRQWNIIKVKKILSVIENINTHFWEFLNLLWHEQRKRYLIVFQNADEIRPTWGFMWSMWLLEVFKWKVQLFQKKDVYAIEWDLKTANYERLAAPKGINELTETFWLRDSNYFVNLKDSSQAIKFFTDNAGIDIDGIIYINQNTLLRFLEITGPIYFEELNMYISHENFSQMMSLVVEAKIFKWWTLGTPKQVLFDFIELFIDELVDQGRYFDYLQAVIHDVESRDIMMWSFKESQNAFLTDMWLNGKIDYNQTLDLIYPSFTSLSGNKSDRYMMRRYNHIVRSWSSCSYEIETEILSQHQMTQSDIQSIQSTIDTYELDDPNLLEIQGAARNRQFVRIILPSWAKVAPREDFEIVDYWARKWIEFFLDTPLGETSFYSFQYALQNPDCQDYNYMFYKQPGIPSYDISIDVDGQKYEYLDRQEDFYFELRDENETIIK